MKINILTKGKEATESEKQIIKVAVFNIASLINTLITGKGMVSNPIEAEENVGLEVFLAHDATKEQQEEFSQRMNSQITMLYMEEPFFSCKIHPLELIRFIIHKGKSKYKIFNITFRIL